jgi:hypothetical protein
MNLQAAQQEIARLTEEVRVCSSEEADSSLFGSRTKDEHIRSLKKQLNEKKKSSIVKGVATVEFTMKDPEFVRKTNINKAIRDAAKRNIKGADPVVCMETKGKDGRAIS